VSSDWTSKSAAEAATVGFGETLGLNFLHVGLELIEAEITVRPKHLNDAGIVHGGMLMSLGDTLGGVGARLSLRSGWTTATVESRTYFLEAARGPILRATCQPLRVGRRLSTWQTEVFEIDRKVAVVSQSQIHLEPR